jgi:hypothetical protein
MAHLEDVRDFGFGGRFRAADLRGFHRAAEKDDDFQEAAFGADEEIAGVTREHDRVVRRVDALRTEVRGGFAQALPRVSQVFGEISRQRGFGGRPAVVRLALLDPLLAVVALVPGHDAILRRLGALAGSRADAAQIGTSGHVGEREQGRSCPR